MGSKGSKHDVDIYPAFEILLKETSGDIVSVGSGFGVTEKDLDKKFNTNIITIDPLEENFCEPDDKSTAKMPMFSTVNDYLSKIKSTTHRDISLILDWPSPNNATYGVKAIDALSPKLILIRYASCGAAGSRNLQSFLRSCSCPSDYSDETNSFNGLYKPIYADQTVIGTGGGFKGKTIDVVVLKKK